MSRCIGDAIAFYLGVREDAALPNVDAEDLLLRIRARRWEPSSEVSEHNDAVANVESTVEIDRGD